MSEAKPSDQESFLATIRRMNAETEKFVAEQRKLIAEGDKLNRDRMLAPLIALGGIIIGGLGVLVGGLGLLLRH